MHSIATFVRQGRPALLFTLLTLLLAGALLGACAGIGGGRNAPAAEAPTSEAPAAEQPATETEVAATDTGAAELVATATPIPPGTRAGDIEPADRQGMFAAPPAMVIDPAKFYYATIKTEQGDIRVQLFADRAPVTVNNFVFLAREGFYDNTVFHRVLADFMAQAGDPTGTGMGGPGYFFEDEIVPGLGFDRSGLVAMANAGPGTNGSQFFLTLAPTEWLTGMHTIFGEVIEGQEVLNSITLRDPDAATDFPGDTITTIETEESDTSVLPTPTPAPPTPTPFAPSALDPTDRPLAALPPAERVNFFDAEAEMTITEGATYTATLETAKGDIVFALDAVNAPVAVNNLVTLANLGFFDGTIVNRVVPGELLIIGSPNNDLETPADVGFMFVPEVGLPSIPMTGSVSFAPMQQGPTGILASGSILMIALAPPPPDSAANYGFFAQVASGEDVLLALTDGDAIVQMTISSSE